MPHPKTYTGMPQPSAILASNRLFEAMFFGSSLLLGSLGDISIAGSPFDRIGWRWLVWHRFSHKNRTRRSSRLQLHNSKKLVRASGIFDSHRPLQSQPSPANGSQFDS